MSLNSYNISFTDSLFFYRPTIFYKLTILLQTHNVSHLTSLQKETSDAPNSHTNIYISTSIYL